MNINEIPSYTKFSNIAGSINSFIEHLLTTYYFPKTELDTTIHSPCSQGVYCQVQRGKKDKQSHFFSTSSENVLSTFQHEITPGPLLKTKSERLFSECYLQLPSLNETQSLTSLVNTLKQYSFNIQPISGSRNRYKILFDYLCSLSTLYYSTFCFKKQNNG